MTGIPLQEPHPPTSARPSLAAWLAMAFIAFRVLHGVFYLTGTHLLRSLVWFCGLGCVVALMVMSALRVGG